MKYLGMAGGIAFTAIMIFGAIILYKKAFGTCGCVPTAGTPETTKMGKILTLDRSIVTDFGAKKDMVS